MKYFFTHTCCTSFQYFWNLILLLDWLQRCSLQIFLIFLNSFSCLYVLVSNISKACRGAAVAVSRFDWPRATGSAPPGPRSRFVCWKKKSRAAMGLLRRDLFLRGEGVFLWCYFVCDAKRSINLTSWMLMAAAYVLISNLTHS
jgi:hypothetical protein